MLRTTLFAPLIAACALAATGEAAAAECKATIDSNDAMQFSTQVLTVPASCARFTVTLRHTGKLPVTAMGHNVVIARSADAAAVAADGMKAGAAAHYVKPGDPRVVGASRLVGGGQSATVDIPVAKLKRSEAYAFFCSFPGHSSIMRGTLALK